MPHSINATLSIFRDSLSMAIIERIAQSRQFTTVTDNAPSEIAPLSLGLLCLAQDYSTDERLIVTHICLLKKGQRVATNQIRIKGMQVVDLPRVRLAQIIAAVPKQNRKVVAKYFSDGYRKVPLKTGEALLKALLKICPDKKREIKKLISQLDSKYTYLRGPRNSDIASEKDALGLSLDIFGIDRSDILQTWQLQEGKLGTSFLSGLSEYQAYEDDIISHDLHTLPGWRAVSTAIAGVVEFENEDKEKLTIINANRKPLEKATGVDLIYFHRKYEAFTLVQYKMMDKGDSNRLYFNPKQKSHKEELSRMQKIYTLLQKNEKGTSLEDYRFSDCPIFFKLCKKLQFKANETTIAPGAYIPLNQWNFLLNHSSTIGPNGGRQLGYHTLGKRYIGTQTFVDLVQKGFLGTQSFGSRKVALFIEAALNFGHSVMYAIDNRIIETSKNDEQETDLF